MSEHDNTCRQCGMPCDLAEYHPYAACLMYLQCHDSEVVKANLSAVTEAAKREVYAELERLAEKWSREAAYMQQRSSTHYANELRKLIGEGK